MIGQTVVFVLSHAFLKLFLSHGEPLNIKTGLNRTSSALKLADRNFPYKVINTSTAHQVAPVIPSECPHSHTIEEYTVLQGPVASMHAWWRHLVTWAQTGCYCVTYCRDQCRFIAVHCRSNLDIMPHAATVLAIKQTSEIKGFKDGEMHWSIRRKTAARCSQRRLEATSG